MLLRQYGTLVEILAANRPYAGGLQVGVRVKEGIDNAEHQDMDDEAFLHLLGLPDTTSTSVTYSRRATVVN